MKNIKWKYLGEAILSVVVLFAAIAFGFALILFPVVLESKFNFDYFWVFYIFYGFVIAVVLIYSGIARGEYIEEVYVEGERIHKLISKYEAKGMRVVDNRMFDYKARVYYNKETNTITLT